MTARNVIDGQTHELLTSIGTWAIADAEPHTLSYTSEVVKFTDKGSLKITAGTANPVIVETGSFSAGDQFGWPSRGFFWIYSDYPITVAAAPPFGSSGIGSGTPVFPGKWTLISTSGETPGEDDLMSMSIAISNLNVNETAYITHPVITAPNAISRNFFAAESWWRLPEYLRESDATQSSPDFPLLRFIDTLTHSADDIYALWEAYRYSPPEDGRTNVSALQPEAASMEVLRWWAPLLGITLYDPTIGSTTWRSLMDRLDTADGVPEWVDWMTFPDTDPADGDVTWSEIENYYITSTGLLELIRWQIRTAFYGIRGGTQKAIVDSVKKALTGTQATEFVPMVGGDPWKFKVKTIQSETPDVPLIGESSGVIEEIVNNSIPAGFEFVHETVLTLP